MNLSRASPIVLPLISIRQSGKQSPLNLVACQKPTLPHSLVCKLMRREKCRWIDGTNLSTMLAYFLDQWGREAERLGWRLRNCSAFTQMHRWPAMIEWG